MTVKKTSCSPALPVLICILVSVLSLTTGCATAGRPRPVASRFSDILSLYPQTLDPLKMPQLLTTGDDPALHSPAPRDIYIIVHPAYAIFVRDLTKDAFPDVKYILQKRQFYNEAKFIASESLAGNIVILIIPGRYTTNSAYPLSYTAYLNNMTWGSNSVYYIYSESPNSGGLSIDDMVSLYRILRGMNARRVLVGGGYIGRCQREFFNQLTTYLDSIPAFIVPEISTISPEDISEEEAATMLKSLRAEDYAPIKSFIQRKIGTVNLLSIPQSDKPVFR